MPERGHRVVVTLGPDSDPDQPEYETRIECLSLAHCGGWTECREPHVVDGVDASEGPWEASEGLPWSEVDEGVVFHGVPHEWRSGYGWTVAYQGCIVQWSDTASEAADEIAQDNGVGSYLVDDEWDEDCWLYVYLCEIPRRVA